MIKKKEHSKEFLKFYKYEKINSVFQGEYKLIEDIFENAIIVLDTNTLLLPYEVGTKSLDLLKDTYRQIGKRLILPGIVVREFLDNRPHKLTSFYDKIKGRTMKFNKQSLPILKSFENYDKFIDVQNNLEIAINNYNEYIKEFTEIIENWYWDDPVSIMYRDIFNEKNIVNVPK